MILRPIKLVAITATFVVPAAVVAGEHPPCFDPDPCVVYPYYGATTTPVPTATIVADAERANAASDPDPCVVYPYYGATTTPVPTATPAAIDAWDSVTATFGADSQFPM